MRALSGLTPALSRRLQRQLLAHLPPAAARSLRRTLSLHTPDRAAPASRTARSHSADHQAPVDTATSDVDDTNATSHHSPEKSPDTPETVTPHYSTLPRLRRRSDSREATSPILSTTDVEPSSPPREPATEVRRSVERPLLSKYLTPERTLSFDESYGSDGGSAKSEPTPLVTGSLAARRYSLRAPSSDQPRRRVSRFLRSDFFDTPPDENLYERQRKERELETQKILREIREKRTKLQEATVAKSPTDVVEAPPAYRDDISTPKKSLSPIGLLIGKERSRSNTPFFPILDNIKETIVDTSLSLSPSRRYGDENVKLKSIFDESSTKESRLVRPKSYPVKILDSIDEPCENMLSDTSLNVDVENNERSLPRESKLLRPKSYPTSSPSPEKVYINRTIKKEDIKNIPPKDDIAEVDNNNDVEVSFSITLPRKSKPDGLNSEPRIDSTTEPSSESTLATDQKSSESSLSLKKYQIVKSKENEESEVTEVKTEKNSNIPNTESVLNTESHDDIIKVTSNGDANHKIATQSTKKDEMKSKSSETDQTEKKGTVKKKIIRKVSSKSKTDLASGQESNETKVSTEKKKVVKKVKEKVADDESAKPATTIKKKSMLQSIGQKLEKFASTKSNSPEKAIDNNTAKKSGTKLNRMQREQSVPVNIEPTTESNLIKRAVTLTDVAALENQAAQPSKTTVSKVLGLFKKFEPKERSKPIVEKLVNEKIDNSTENNCKAESNLEPVGDQDEDKPRRPTSLLLNGLGRKNRYDRTSSDSVSVLPIDSDDLLAPKKESEPKNIRNTLKLDFSRLPRVKKIVPTNPVIEPQIMNTSFDSKTDKKDIPDKYNAVLDSSTNIDNVDSVSRSRSRSRSTISNSEIKSDINTDSKLTDKYPLPTDNNVPQQKSHDSITPEKEDLVDRIRRKSFYSRFNEKKQRRKSNLVGPGAVEYDPVARIHSQPTETKYDVSPTSPMTYDLSPLSPGLSVSSDLSPSTERYRSLLTEMPISSRGNLRFENYGLNDKIDTYRSLDRNDFRKYPGSRNYLDYDPPTYGTSRYSRTKSLLENSDTTEDNNSLGNSLRDPHKYNRTISMYSPGSYATYRPKRTTRNSAIILKESEKEPSPENILDKIRQKKISISVTRKPDPEKETLPRSNIPSKGEGDGAECSEKVN